MTQKDVTLMVLIRMILYYKLINLQEISRTTNLKNKLEMIAKTKNHFLKTSLKYLKDIHPMIVIQIALREEGIRYLVF